MDYKQGKYQIIKKENLSRNCYSYTLLCPEVAELAQAGQFAHIKAEGFSLRRPISICEVDKAKGTLRLVFEVRGDGTAEISKLNEGEMMDVMAPLGKGFTQLPTESRVIVVGGGIGTPPMLEVVKRYKKEGSIAILGFRSADAVILKKEFEQAAGMVILCTDDGTAGEKGYVSNALAKALNNGKADMIFACGPHPMLKAVIELAEKHDVPCEVSLEERMGCGVGACLVCACKTVKDGKEYFSHVCKDGPVFDSKTVVL